MDDVSEKLCDHPSELTVERTDERKLAKRVSKLERILRQHTRAELDDRQDFRRLLFRSFISGIVRGGGTVIGIALLGTLLVFLLKWLADHNSREISEFVAELVRWIQRSM